MPTGISSLLDDNTLVTSKKDVANLLNTYFSMVYAKENINYLSVAYEAVPFNGSTLSDGVVTPKVIEGNLRTLNCIKSQGLDGIPARFLKELSKELALSLSTLFRNSIESGVLPLLCKTDILTPFLEKEHVVSQTIIDQLVLHVFCVKYFSQLSWMLL